MVVGIGRILDSITSPFTNNVMHQLCVRRPWQKGYMAQQPASGNEELGWLVKKTSSANCSLLLLEGEMAHCMFG